MLFNTVRLFDIATMYFAKMQDKFSLRGHRFEMERRRSKSYMGGLKPDIALREKALFQQRCERWAPYLHTPSLKSKLEEMLASSELTLSSKTVNVKPRAHFTLRVRVHITP